MQKLAAYLLERRDGLRQAKDRILEGGQIRSVIEAWMRKKGAEDGAQRGNYVAEDNSDATFEVTQSEDGERSWTLYRLSEVFSDARRFLASLSVTIGESSVFLFVTLEVGSVTTQVNQIRVDARCPKVIRTLLELPGVWYHGASKLQRLTHVSGFGAGEALAQEVHDEARTIPFVVVSTIDGSPALDGLDQKLAYDLAGIANVFTVDEDAAWAITDALGKPLSCYSGAVRIYWPRFCSDDNRLRHHLWTASRLTSLERNDRQGRERFGRQLRKLIMRASAASVVRPPEIDEIRNTAARAKFAAQKAKARSAEDFQDLADSYAKDNDALRKELMQKDKEIAQLQSMVAKLESEKESLSFHLRRVKPELVQNEDDDDVEPDLTENEPTEPGSPEKGEVRFYKKRYSAPNHDVMVRVGDCAHNKWRGAAKADKAKKGIAKLENNRKDWKLIEHCGQCKGGGVWRVKW